MRPVRMAKTASDHERQQAQGGLDEDDEGKVPPLAVGVDLAEDEGGVELGHAFYVDQTHEVGLGQQMETGDGEEADGRLKSWRGAA